jgi:hypothetical protein
MKDENELQAGAETDALIERVVFGKIIKRDERGKWYTLRSETDSVRKLPRAFSTNIAAAHEVLDAWEGDYEVRRQNGLFRVELFRPSEEFQEWAETFPLAVCRARLKAASRDGAALADAASAQQEESR